MPAQREIDQQRDYWNREVDSFDAIYTHRKSLLASTLDSIFRKDMYLRYTETLVACEPVAGRRFLDVGCGTGLYALELARRGAAFVCGVDIAERMVQTCIARAEEEGTAAGGLTADGSGVMSFIRGEIGDLPEDESFDVSIAIGLFDYLPDAVPTLRSMRVRTSDRVIATFPRLLTWRAPVRKLRLTLRGCPVYFYTVTGIREALAAADLYPVEIRRIGKLYFVVARPDGIQPFATQ